MKRNAKLFNLGLITLMGGALASCSNELNEPSYGGGNSGNGIGLIKSPDMIAWSGNETIGTTKTLLPDGYSFQTRGSDMNANMWNQNWDCPSRSAEDLSDKELAELKALLSKGKETHNEIILNYENYYVQQIYKGESSYRAKDNNGGDSNEYVIGSDKMNHLQANNGGSYEHINNFNYGNNTNIPGKCGCGKVHSGTTLMINMSLDNIEPNNQFGFDESWGTQPKFFNNYIIVEYEGYYYVGFDYEAHKQRDTHNSGEAMQIDRDWNFTDWIVRIIPAYPKGTTPGQPGDSEDNDKPGDSEDNDQPGNGGSETINWHENEVEVNFSINDTHDHYDIEDLVSKLSIHVRYPNDVTVTIPVPTSHVVEADDLAIVLSHKTPDESYGKSHTATYNINGNDVKLKVTYFQDEDDATTTYIMVTTTGINEDVINYLMEKNGDGINFEIYNYYHWNEKDSDGNWVRKPGNVQISELQTSHLNNATITFHDKNYPDYYINAFGCEYNDDGEKIEDLKKVNDCTVSIVNTQISDFGSPIGPTNHLNGTKWNYIYVKKGVNPNHAHKVR